MEATAQEAVLVDMVEVHGDTKLQKAFYFAGHCGK